MVWGEREGGSVKEREKPLPNASFLHFHFAVSPTRAAWRPRGALTMRAIAQGSPVLRHAASSGRPSVRSVRSVRPFPSIRPSGGAGLPPPPPPPPRRPVCAAAGDGGDTPPFLRGGSTSGGTPSLLRLVALGIGLAAAALAAAPSLLSSRPGKSLVCRLLARAMGGRVRVTCDRLALSWRRPPEMVGLVVTPRSEERGPAAGADNDGASSPPLPAPPPQPVLSLGRASATASLGAIAFTRRPFDVVLSQPYVDLFLTPDGATTRLERALGGGNGRGREGEEGDADDDAAALRDAETFGTAREPGPDPSGVLGPPVPQPFSAEVRAGRVSLFVADGTARVPEDAREVVTGGAAARAGRFGKPPPPPGPVHAVVLVGADALTEDGESLGWDGAAWDDPGGDPHDARAVLASGSSYDAAWATAAARRPRAARAPIAATLRAPGLRAQASGWIVGGGGAWSVSPAAAAAGLARGWLSTATKGSKKKRLLDRQPAWSLRLRDPGIAVAAACTPALARTGLARLSPLLADAVGMQDAASVRVCVAPAGLSLPAASAVVRVAPLKLRLVGAAASSSKPSLAGRLLGLLGGAGAKGGALTAWTAPAAVEVGPAGLSIPRFDILLSAAEGGGGGGGRRGGVHLVTWGVVDPGGRRCALTVGVPGRTLSALGFAGIPPATLLPIAVRGPLRKPRVDFVGASARLAALVAAGAAEGGGGAEEEAGPALAALRRALGRGVGRKVGALAGAGRVGTGPPPPAYLPWEAGARLPTQIEDAKRRQAEAVGEWSEEQ